MRAIDHPPSSDLDALFSTDLPLPDRRQGKVRDIYRMGAPAGAAGSGRSGPPCVLIVATDRISAFDVVLPTPIPGKGRILTDISTRWFAFVRGLGLIEDHLISTDPHAVPGLTEEDRRRLEGRVTIGHEVRIIPVECVVRGYITGSGWVEYQRDGSVCGIPLPAGLRQCDKLPEPIFTPATKATEGHDENISFEQAAAIAGAPVMERLRDASIRIYEAAADLARERGVILADTKFEFGYAMDQAGEPTERILLADEILTPDSSRFWPGEAYEPGRDQESFDKQYVRNHLLELVAAGKWDKTPPGPELPDDVVRNTVARYEEARRRLF